MIRKPELESEAGKAMFLRLKTIAQSNARPLHSVLVRYALERFLYRLFSDGAAGSERIFVAPGAALDLDSTTLKGGMTLTFAESVPVLEGRSTGDADLHLASFGGGMEDYCTILQAGLRGKPRHGPDDGLRFDVAAIKVARDRDERSGGSVVVPVQIGAYYLQFKTDVTFDARPMHDKAPVLDYPSVMPDSEMPAPVIRRVPYEFMVADKFHAALGYGMANKRIRDYADMRLILGKGLVETEFLAETIAATVRFNERELPVSMDDLPGFSDDFAQQKASRWEHEKRDRHFLVQEDFPTMLAWLREYLEPVIARAREIEDLPAWSSGPR